MLEFRFHLSQLSAVLHMNIMPAFFCLLTNNVGEGVCEVGVGGNGIGLLPFNFSPYSWEEISIFNTFKSKRGLFKQLIDKKELFYNI